MLAVRAILADKFQQLKNRPPTCESDKNRLDGPKAAGFLFICLCSEHKAMPRKRGDIQFGSALFTVAMCFVRKDEHCGRLGPKDQRVDNDKTDMSV